MDGTPIANAAGYVRSTATQAVINTDSTGYDQYMRQKMLIKQAKEAALSKESTIISMQNDIEELKLMIKSLMEKK